MEVAEKQRSPTALESATKIFIDQNSTYASVLDRLEKLSHRLHDTTGDTEPGSADKLAQAQPNDKGLGPELDRLIRRYADNNSRAFAILEKLERMI